jgi:putative transposase
MYDSDLSDEEWGLIEHHFQRQDNRGARSVHAKRDVVNAILYLNKTGAQWRMLPKSFPPWQTCTPTHGGGTGVGHGRRRSTS